MKTLHHIHLIMTVGIKKAFSNSDESNTWMKNLVEVIGMDEFYPPISKRSDDPPHNVGITGISLLTCSHLSHHQFEYPDGTIEMKFDLYSCQHFSIDDVMSHFVELEPTFFDYIVIDRNERNKVVDQGFISV